MPDSRSLIMLLAGRYLWPAGGSGKNWRQSFSYRLVSFLPSMGMITSLTVIADFGLTTASAHHRLEARLEEIRESPYLALFASGRFFMEDEVKACDAAGKEDLDYWVCVRIRELDRVSRRVPHLGEQRLIRQVYPYDEVYLRLQKTDGEHLRPSGIAIAFSGVRSDQRLLEEVRKGLAMRAEMLEESGGVPVILVTARLLDRLGYDDREQWPGQLVLKRTEEDSGVPFRVRVAERLPYNMGYAISLEAWDRLKADYYHQPVASFEVLLDGSPEQLERYHRVIEASFDLDGRPSDPFARGDRQVSIVTLREEVPRRQILAGLPEASLGLGSFRPDVARVRRGGAIFRLNPALLELSTAGADGRQTTVLRLIDEFLTEHEPQVRIRGELLEALAESAADRQHFVLLRDAFVLGSLLLGLVVMLFFAIVLHTRLPTLGTLRAHGVGPRVILRSFALEGAVLSFTAFGLASVLFWCFGGGVSGYFSGFGMVWILAGLFLTSQVGTLMPSLYALRRFEPAELWTQ